VKDKNYLNIIVPVWGKDYLNTFLNISLKFLFSENNLPFLSKKKNFVSTFKIYTYEKHIKQITDSDSYQKLVSLLSVEFVSIDKLKENITETSPRIMNFQLMNLCHQNASEKAINEKAILIFINADSICSDNTIKSLISSIENGYKAVCVNGIRLGKESFIKGFQEFYKKNDLSPRNLNDFALDNLHPFSKLLFCKNNKFPVIYDSYYWKLDEKNILIRSFHLHPIMIWPQKICNLHSSIDNTFVQEVGISKEKIKIIDDSDDFVCFELTSESITNFYLPAKNFIYFKLIEWLGSNLLSFHWEYAHKPIFLKTTDTLPFWENIVKNSDNQISNIEKMVKIYKFFRGNKILRNLGRIFKHLLQIVFHFFEIFKIIFLINFFNRILKNQKTENI
jgi:hypothetical protein